MTKAGSHPRPNARLEEIFIVLDKQLAAMHVSGDGELVVGAAMEVVDALQHGLGGAGALPVITDTLLHTVHDIGSIHSW